jgi:hypothetical protein
VGVEEEVQMRRGSLIRQRKRIMSTEHDGCDIQRDIHCS